MKSFYHIFKLNLLQGDAVRARVLRMWCEEVQRHVSPEVALLRIALKNRHQLDNRYPEVLQVWNLLHQTGVRAGTRRIHAGVGVLGAALDVKLIDDRVSLLMRG